jgi:hypothetical protein
VVLTSRSGPPKNLLAREPHLARLWSSYQLCKHLTCLPEDGGLLDQSAEWVAFAGVFAATEADYQKAQNKGR